MACPKIRELRVRAVRVPMAQPHKSASGIIAESPLVLTDIVADRYDAGFRRGNLVARDMIAVRATNDLHYRVVASPDYVARHGLPQTPDDLHAHNCIRYRLPGGGFIPWLFVGDGKMIEFDVSGSLIVINDPELVIHAALQGVGVAYLYEEYVARMIADGRLVSILDKSVLPVTDGFFLFYPSRRQNSAALRALIDFLRSELRQNGSAARAQLVAAMESIIPSDLIQGE